MDTNTGTTTAPNLQESLEILSDRVSNDLYNLYSTPSTCSKFFFYGITKFLFSPRYSKRSEVLKDEIYDCLVSVLSDPEIETIHFSEDEMDKMIDNGTEIELAWKFTLISFSKGSYGYIFKLKEHPEYVLKMSKADPNHGDQQFIGAEEEFVQETFLHSLLFTLEKEFVHRHSSTYPVGFGLVVPLKSIIFTRDGQGVMLMNLLKGNLFAYFRENRVTFPTFLLIMIRICYMVYIMQRFFMFNHRDLHLGNILYDDPLPETQNSESQDKYGFWGDAYEMQFFDQPNITSLVFPSCPLRLFLNDFGLSCANFDNQIIPLPEIHPRIDSDFYFESQHCKSFTHDLRLLYFSLIQVQQTSGIFNHYQEILRHLEVMNSKTTLIRDFQNSRTFENRDETFQEYSYKAYTTDEIEFHPLHLIRRLGGLFYKNVGKPTQNAELSQDDLVDPPQIKRTRFRLEDNGEEE